MYKPHDFDQIGEDLNTHSQKLKLIFDMLNKSKGL